MAMGAGDEARTMQRHIFFKRGGKRRWRKIGGWSALLLVAAVIMGDRLYERDWALWPRTPSGVASPPPDSFSVDRREDHFVTRELTIFCEEPYRLDNAKWLLDHTGKLTDLEGCAMAERAGLALLRLVHGHPDDRLPTSERRYWPVLLGDRILWTFNADDPNGPSAVSNLPATSP